MIKQFHSVKQSIISSHIICPAPQYPLIGHLRVARVLSGLFMENLPPKLPLRKIRCCKTQCAI